MRTVLIILGILAVIVGCVISLADILEWSKRRRIVLAVLFGVIGIVAVNLGFWLSNKPATKQEIQEIVQTGDDSLHRHFDAKFDALDERLKLSPEIEEGDSTYRAETRKLAERLQKVAKTGIEKGMVAIGLEKYDEALTLLDLALEAAHDNLNQRGEVFFYMGLVRFRLAEYELAIDCFDSCVTYSPGLYEPWNNRGTVLGALGRYEEAFTNYEKVLKRYPTYAQAWHGKAMSLEYLGRFDEAMKCYDKVIEISPAFNPAITQRERLLEKWKNSN